MSFRSTLMGLVAVAAVVCVAVPALTQNSPGAADAQRGHKLAYTCYGCHGIENYKNVYPTYSVPKLEGQHPEYLAAALAAYKSGERSHGTMHAQASSMNDQDMQDIAVFLAGKNVLQVSPTPVAKPANAPKALEVCVACHGADGISIAAMYPTLAGQHADYLARALHDYKNGGRKNAIMAGFAAQLSDSDIKELAAYYSRQRPSLSTAEHAIWFTGEKKAAEAH